MNTPLHNPSPPVAPLIDPAQLSDASLGPTTGVGVEWLVEALNCDPDRLRDTDELQRLCNRILVELGLRAVREGVWHQFPGPGGVTGMYLLAESHLTCHTYPEFQLATFNLYCCRPRPRWRWEGELGESLGAGEVVVRVVPRGWEGGR